MSDSGSSPPTDSTPRDPSTATREKLESPFPLIWVGWWITVITVSDQAMISPLLPNLLDYFSVEIQEGGKITGAYFLGAASMTPVAGILADRIGCRAVLILAIAFVAMGEFGSALADPFSFFLVSRVLVGAGSAAASLALTTYVGLHIPYSDRGKVMGWIGTGFFLGNTFGPFFVTQLVAQFGLHFLFVTLAGLSTFGIFHTAYTLRNDPPHRRVASSWKGYREVIANRGVRGLIAVQSLFTFGVMGMIQFFGQWLEEVHHLDTRSRGLVFLVGGLPILIGSPIGGWVCDRIGKKPFFLGVTLVLAGVTCLLPHIEESYFLVIFLFATIGFVVAGRYSAYHALTTRLIEKDLLGHLLATRNFVNYLVAAAGVVWMGYVYQSSPTAGYIRMGWLTALLLLLSVPFLIRMIPEEPVDE